MKKLIFVLIALLVVAGALAAGIGSGGSGVGGFPASPTFSGTVSSTKACAAGYTRKGPNFCSRDLPAFVALTRDVCTAIAAPASDAKMLLVHLQSRAVTGNLANQQRNAGVNSWDDSSCSVNKHTGTDARGYEAEAVVGATVGGDNKQAVVKIISGNARLLLFDDTGNQGTGGYEIQGYFD